MNDDIILEVHPVMFRSNPLGYVIAVLLIPLVIGIVILLLWNLRCRRTVVQVTDKEIIYRKRLFREEVIRVGFSDISNVITGQTICTRKLDAGSILLVTTRGEIVLEGVPEPERIEELINIRSG